MKIIEKILNIIGSKENKSVDKKYNEEKFYVVGVCYYENNIKKLRVKNELWKSKDIIGKKIYKYNYINKPVKLVPDPQNEHDKNAVKVIVAGEVVGFISRNENEHVLSILKNADIKYISSFIGGGEYKIISENGDVASWENENNVTVKIGYVM